MRGPEVEIALPRRCLGQAAGCYPPLMFEQGESFRKVHWSRLYRPRSYASKCVVGRSEYLLYGLPSCWCRCRCMILLLLCAPLFVTSPLLALLFYLVYRLRSREAARRPPPSSALSCARTSSVRKKTGCSSKTPLLICRRCEGRPSAGQLSTCTSTIAWLVPSYSSSVLSCGGDELRGDDERGAIGVVVLLLLSLSGSLVCLLWQEGPQGYLLYVLLVLTDTSYRHPQGVLHARRLF